MTSPAQHLAQTTTARLPLTANFHFIKACNFRRDYCWATFADQIALRGMRPHEELFEITRLLARRYTKVTFVGGEPTIYARLPELLATAKAEGALTNLVTNGSRIDAAWMAEHADLIDFLTLSIDSDDAFTHQALGRAAERGETLPTTHYLQLADAARLAGIVVKVNTVVTTRNADEDLSGLIREMAPERWKILQATPVEGQNDGRIEDLTPDRADFDAYVSRHQEALAGTGIRVVPEPIDMIRGSYIMVDPQGRFFDSTTGAHHHSRPILEAGLQAAFDEIAFDATKFEVRGGNADYTGTADDDR